MAKPSFVRTLSEVTQRETVKKELLGKNGKTYLATVVRELVLQANSKPTEKGDKGYSYSGTDVETDLEYVITVPDHVEAKYGDTLIFRDVQGGTFNGKAWFKAESVELDLLDKAVEI